MIIIISVLLFCTHQEIHCLPYAGFFVLFHCILLFLTFNKKKCLQHLPVPSTWYLAEHNGLATSSVPPYSWNITLRGLQTLGNYTGLKLASKRTNTGSHKVLPSLVRGHNPRGHILGQIGFLDKSHIPTLGVKPMCVV